ncbi:MAG: hypothetical protein JXB00_20795 [Bacteroidales bacterium]|nr:hypothetical protein [Bacteroidales bacterium]
MKKLIFLTLLLPFSIICFSQRDANVGIFAGTAYYMGDINPNRHFYRPRPSLGLLYRYNFNNHYSLRANAYYAYLSGSDIDFASEYHADRHTRPVDFNTSVLDGTVQFEFNFLPYVPNNKKWEYTTYVSGGIGYSMILGSGVGTSYDAVRNPVPHFTFPFGVGFKLNLTRTISAGAEWSFRKSFSDRVDFLTNPSRQTSFTHNNDWYSFAGIFITYKFFNFAVDCPAYAQ